MPLHLELTYHTDEQHFHLEFGQATTDTGTGSKPEWQVDKWIGFIGMRAFDWRSSTQEAFRHKLVTVGEEGVIGAAKKVGDGDVGLKERVKMSISLCLNCSLTSRGI
jgi:hypothetical protein